LAGADWAAQLSLKQWFGESASRVFLDFVAEVALYPQRQLPSVKACGLQFSTEVGHSEWERLRHKHVLVRLLVEQLVDGAFVRVLGEVELGQVLTFEGCCLLRIAFVVGVGKQFNLHHGLEGGARIHRRGKADLDLLLELQLPRRAIAFGAVVAAERFNSE